VSALFQKLLGAAKKQGGAFLLLLDPDRTPERDYLAITEAAEGCGVDAILVGSSFVLESRFHEAVRDIKNITHLPVIIFPGSSNQITSHADAILFTSLLSGRNPQHLIDEQVKGAPLVKNAGLEVIPCGYLLIDSGGYTSVQFMSSSLPIPRTKYDIACAHALAAQYMGMQTVYLEAGSGARLPVPDEMVKAVASYIDIPVIVGGGLTTPEECASRIEAGATFVVVGNHLEQDNRLDLLRELTAAAHPLQSVRI